MPLPIEEWRSYQRQMRDNVILHDDFEWSLDQEPKLKYVGGVDISTEKHGRTGAEHAVAALVVLSFPIILVDGFGLLHPRRAGCASHLGVETGCVTIGVAKNLLHTDGLEHNRVMAQTKRILRNRRNNAFDRTASSQNQGNNRPSSSAQSNSSGSRSNFYKQQLSASIRDGVYEVTTVNSSSQAGSSTNNNNVVVRGYTLPLRSQRDGVILGHALFGHRQTQNPIFISQGHRVSLETALEIVRRCCLYRIPEPIRQADKRSRKEVSKRGY
eukprot:TRINITY_DN3341_c0_g1_i1.p2 TRINITY_DN3341_c0_g1~~TRINITY_DN3341_c0_g1_i1.p2  ORF type:complete len:294 (+),score=12.93 TRINITY_DN3341_c0_g1_i1:74-883(+)